MKRSRLDKYINYLIDRKGAMWEGDIIDAVQSKYHWATKREILSALSNRSYEKLETGRRKYCSRGPSNVRKDINC